MTQHSSLKSSLARQQHRSVLKRYERLKFLKDKGEWDEKSSIFKLPKIKSIKLKVKKEKAVEEKATTEETPKQAQTAKGPSEEAEKKKK